MFSRLACCTLTPVTEIEQTHREPQDLRGRPEVSRDMPHDMPEVSRALDGLTYPDELLQVVSQYATSPFSSLSREDLVRTIDLENKCLVNRAGWYTLRQCARADSEGDLPSRFEADLAAGISNQRMRAEGFKNLLLNLPAKDLASACEWFVQESKELISAYEDTHGLGRDRMWHECRPFEEIVHEGYSAGPVLSSSQIRVAASGGLNLQEKAIVTTHLRSAIDSKQKSYSPGILLDAICPLLPGHSRSDLLALVTRPAMVAAIGANILQGEQVERMDIPYVADQKDLDLVIDNVNELNHVHTVSFQFAPPGTPDAHLDLKRLGQRTRPPTEAGQGLQNVVVFCDRNADGALAPPAEPSIAVSYQPGPVAGIREQERAPGLPPPGPGVVLG